MFGKFFAAPDASREADTAVITVAHYREARARHDAAIAAELQTLSAAEDVAAARFAAWQDALSNSQAVRQVIADLNRTFDRVRSQYERQRLASVDPAITAFLDWYTRERAALNGKVRRFSIRRSKTEAAATGSPATSEGSNQQAIALIADALGRARQAAEACIYDPPEDLAAALEDLRRSIPTLEDAERQTATDDGR